MSSFSFKECSKGIFSRNYDHTNQTILTEAKVQKGYRDLHFIGSFCPPHDGEYRLLFEGTLDVDNEDEYSSYEFNNVTSKNRTTPYYLLFSHTCYPYRFTQSVGYSETNNGSLYFQEKNQEKQIITNETSLTCHKLVCLSGSKHPQCLKYITYVSQLSNMKSTLIIMTVIFLGS